MARVMLSAGMFASRRGEDCGAERALWSGSPPPVRGRDGDFANELVNRAPLLHPSLPFALILVHGYGPDIVRLPRRAAVRSNMSTGAFQSTSGRNAFASRAARRCASRRPSRRAARMPQLHPPRRRAGMASSRLDADSDAPVRSTEGKLGPAHRHLPSDTSRNGGVASIGHPRRAGGWVDARRLSDSRRPDTAPASNDAPPRPQARAKPGASSRGSGGGAAQQGPTTASGPWSARASRLEAPGPGESSAYSPSTPRPSLRRSSIRGSAATVLNFCGACGGKN